MATALEFSDEDTDSGFSFTLQESDNGGENSPYGSASTPDLVPTEEERSSGEFSHRSADPEQGTDSKTLSYTDQHLPYCFQDKIHDKPLLIRARVIGNAGKHRQASQNTIQRAAEHVTRKYSTRINNEQDTDFPSLSDIGAAAPEEVAFFSQVCQAQEIKRTCDEAEQVYKELLKHHQEFLLDHLQRPVEITDRLLSFGCISPPDNAKVDHRKTLHENCNNLLKIIHKRKCASKFFIALGEIEPNIKVYLCNKLEDSTDSNRTIKKKKVLTERHVNFLFRHFSHLLQCRSVYGIIVKLYSETVISNVQREVLKALSTEYERMRIIVRDIVARGTYTDLLKFWKILKIDNPGTANLLTPILKEEGMVEESTHPANKKAEDDLLKRTLAHPDEFGDDLGHDIIKSEKGSIRLYLQVRYWQEVLDIEDEICFGIMQKKISKHLEKRLGIKMNVADIECALEIDSNTRAGADVLAGNIRYRYCKSKRSWYWSADNDSWCHSSIGSWPFRPDFGKVPREKDRQMLQKLMLQFDDVKACKDCIICATRSLFGDSKVRDENLGHLKVCLVIKLLQNQVIRYVEDFFAQRLLSDLLKTAKYKAGKKLLRQCHEHKLEFGQKLHEDVTDFFDAVCDQLNQLEFPRHSPNRLRKEVIEFMLETPPRTHVEGSFAWEDFISVYDNDIEDYCQSMLKKGEWVEHRIIQSTAAMLGTDIWVLRPDGKTVTITGGKNVPKKTLQLGYIPEERRYRSLVPKGGILENLQYVTELLQSSPESDLNMYQI